MAKRGDIDRLKERVGTFEAPIGSVQLPETGVRYDKRGNPKPLQSGQDEHPEPGDRAPRKRKPKEPELAFSTDLFIMDPEEQKVLSACHKALAGRQITEHELRTKLAKGEFEAERVEHAVTKCREQGLIDDLRYATAYVESRVRRGHGAQRIRQDLARRGIAREITEGLLVEAKDDGALDEGAVAAARKKFARVDLADRTVESKAVRWLLTRGYSSGQAYAAVRVVRGEQADSEE
ncbi:MAG: recombination regulator RecX [Thermoleophilia bacterium]|nr:recombination regulator RecX [Thermoleophilia bacterium]